MKSIPPATKSGFVCRSIERVVLIQLLANGLFGSMMAGETPAGGFPNADRTFQPGNGPALLDVTFDQGTFVGVGAEGLIVRFEDGEDWIQVDAGTSRRLDGIAFGGDRWIAVGALGTILSSRDLEHWRIEESTVTGGLRSVIFANCRYVAVGDGGTALVSFDGVIWARRDTGTSSGLRTVFHAHGWLFAGGMDRTLLQSRDGTRWRQAMSPGVFGIADMLSTGDGLLVVGCGGALRYRPDTGATHFEALPEQSAFHAATAGKGLLVAVGRDGGIWRKAAGSDRAWERVDSGTHRGLHGIAYGDGRFVAVGCAGSIVTSNDGRTWRRITR